MVGGSTGVCGIVVEVRLMRSGAKVFDAECWLSGGCCDAVVVCHLRLAISERSVEFSCCVETS